MRIGAARIAHLVSLVTFEDLDDEVRGWLTGAYAAATD
jgi:hypothetical protein